MCPAFKFFRSVLVWPFVLSFVVIGFACEKPSKGNKLTEDSAHSLLESLSNFHGKFNWDEENQRYVFSRKQELEQVLSGKTEQLIDALVESLDDLHASNVTLEDKKVALGVVYYEALTRLAYYEPTDINGDIAKNWPGFLQPTANEAELSAAKKAWREVLENHVYILY